MTIALGIDVGGTSIKGALVDTASGLLRSDRVSCTTEQPATPESVRDAVEKLIADLTPGSATPVGIALPGVVRAGALRTASNLDSSWVGRDLVDLMSATSTPVTTFLNDADAAAIAEARFGEAWGAAGLAVMVTLGTGVGVGLINNGTLVANSELGHLEVDGVVGERFASARARATLALSWKEWAAYVSTYLRALERLLWPEIIIVGGGPTDSAERWFSQLNTRTPLKLARFTKDAGIVGAALAAEDAGIRVPS